MSKITVTDMGSQSPSLSSNRTERINASKGARTSGEGNPVKAESGRGSLDKPRAEGVQVFTDGVRAPPLSSCISAGVAHGEKEACLSYTPRFLNLFTINLFLIILG